MSAVDAETTTKARLFELNEFVEELRSANTKKAELSGLVTGLSQAVKH